MNDPKKKAVTIISAKLGKPEMSEKPKNEMGDEMDHSVGYMSASEDIMQAIQEKSPKRLMEALKSFVEMCKNEEESEYEE